MAGKCKHCKGLTTDTRAASESGLCFGCESGFRPKNNDIEPDVDSLKNLAKVFINDNLETQDSE